MLHISGGSRSKYLIIKQDVLWHRVTVVLLDFVLLLLYWGTDIYFNVR